MPENSSTNSDSILPRQANERRDEAIRELRAVQNELAALGINPFYIDREWSLPELEEELKARRDQFNNRKRFLGV